MLPLIAMVVVLLIFILLACRIVHRGNKRRMQAKIDFIENMTKEARRVQEDIVRRM